MNPAQKPIYPQLVLGPAQIRYGSYIAVWYLRKRSDDGLYLETTLLPDKHHYRHILKKSDTAMPYLLYEYTDYFENTPKDPRKIPKRKFEGHKKNPPAPDTTPNRNIKKMRRLLFEDENTTRTEVSLPSSKDRVRKPRKQTRRKLYVVANKEDQASTSQQPSEFSVVTNAADLKDISLLELSEDESI
ncbi:PREDICTED: uncharacterized protein LOC108568839 [Nicrophorus vespilloides]|uniref:Uncharacterized protein LOC108568839 n=1 Tax=Nicrophorus vespilloides TaxID=110193 RepID=A0ABM1NFM8_NICVS|nr:PREDICTED: uncharacterized protein LOC108568839 [Nicrophorus vespilloides]